MPFKIRATDGPDSHDFDVPEENIWLYVLDSYGREHYLGSLFIQRDVFGGFSAQLGTNEKTPSEMWEPANPVQVFNQSLHMQYQTPDRGRG